MSSSSGTSSSGGNQACAACKFQRRRCSADCPLARYFPAEQNQRFMNCKRLFGVSNMVRFLKEVEPNDRDDTMKSLMFEADARERDPVHGCLGIINRLKEQIAKLAEDLSATREQLNYFVEQQQLISTMYAAQQQQQQHHHVQNPPQNHQEHDLIEHPGFHHHHQQIHQQHHHHQTNTEASSVVAAVSTSNEHAHGPHGHPHGHGHGHAHAHDGAGVSYLSL